MCGIAGTVDFTRDFSQDRGAAADAQAMTDTMACRGPDDEGLWSARHAALGHRRLAIIDVPGGRQPMTLEDPASGETRLAIVYSGEVYNFTELRAELQQRGHAFRTDSDTEVILHGWLEYGEDVVERLNGMFAFALWDTRADELFLVRDRMGIKPLYYYPTPDGVLFGSEPKAILAHPRSEAVVDADGLRELLSHVKTPGHGGYRNMHEVRPGSLVRIRQEGLSTRQYWQLEALEHTDDREASVAHVRELLDDIVGRQLISDVPLCSLLSGGLDSSAITALAAQQLADQGAGPVRSFSVDFVGYEDSFAADPMRDTPDGPFVRELAEYVKADHEAITLSNDDLMDPDARAAVLRARDLPLALGDMDTSLYLLFKAIRGRSTVALSGESADEVFGGYRWFHDADAVNADTFPWMAAQNAPMDLQRSFFDPGLMTTLDLPGYVDQSYRDALAEVPHVDGVSAHERRMREVCYLHLTRFVQMLLDRKDRMSMASGLEVRVPFCDHRLVQYVFNTPWSLKTFDGREKSLLRAASKDVLPASIVERVKSPYPSTQDPAYEKALRGDLADLLADPNAPVRALIDVDAVRASIDAPADSATSLEVDRAKTENVLQLDAWMRAYSPTIETG
ncbi:asparagine synthase (glutamine-hydrolyzing) [Actinomycetospora termitidis]|uniref:asparagine synthase (glutamine-hydrolyzing) n=1 Tax=Actinomycetospora termitidis TaxID=3053470 RepID=A0ABT7M4W3_9PSEU|nr:asparagine synthase (glutamine-hydrolyzing) [Actinomycetospora sp. Odt1-22]MDL5155264.1 asparagine synthase (glutamine-hydrolyzing) [Actinomycetospora sp. Odt1-22]